MTERHRIRADQLQVGAPLPVDVYDEENRLLLRRSNIIATEHQLARLVEEGLFSDHPLPTHPRTGAGREHGTRHDGDESDRLVDGPIARPASKPKPRVSVYAEVVAAARELEALHCAPEANPQFGAGIEALAQGLRHAAELDVDATLAHVMFARDVRYPVRQCINVAILTGLLLERAGNDPARTHAAVCAALTMNLTIHALQDTLYRTQAMDEAQRRAIATHPVQCAQLLRELGVSDPLWPTIVEQHHEFVDGTGYPRKLAGETVLREAQVIGLADRYCAAVTERAYRPGLAPNLVIEQIRTHSGCAIAQQLIEELVHWVGMYPPGTVVVLLNRDVSVVTRRLRDPRHPVVVSVSGERLRPYETPRKRLTAANPQFGIERVLPRETIAFPVDPEMLWPRTVDEVLPVLA